MGSRFKECPSPGICGYGREVSSGSTNIENYVLLFINFRKKIFLSLIKNFIT